MTPLAHGALRGSAVRSALEDVLAHDEAFRLACSVLAATTEQHAWWHGRVAALWPAGPGAGGPFAARLARHGAQEERRARHVHRLLAARGLRPAAIPWDTDYPLLLVRAGLGPPPHVLHRDEPLAPGDALAYLALAHATARRALRRTAWAHRHLGERAVPGPAAPAAAGERQLLLVAEQLSLLVEAGQGREVRAALRRAARGEARAHHAACLALADRLTRLLRWSAPRRAALAAALHTAHAVEALTSRPGSLPRRRAGVPEPPAFGPSPLTASRAAGSTGTASRTYPPSRR